MLHGKRNIAANEWKLTPVGWLNVVDTRAFIQTCTSKKFLQ